MLKKFKLWLKRFFLFADVDENLDKLENLSNDIQNFSKGVENLAPAASEAANKIYDLLQATNNNLQSIYGKGKYFLLFTPSRTYMLHDVDFIESSITYDEPKMIITVRMKTARREFLYHHINLNKMIISENDSIKREKLIAAGHRLALKYHKDKQLLIDHLAYKCTLTLCKLINKFDSVDEASLIRMMITGIFDELNLIIETEKKSLQPDKKDIIENDQISVSLDDTKSEEN